MEIVAAICCKPVWKQEIDPSTFFSSDKQDLCLIMLTSDIL